MKDSHLRQIGSVKGFSLVEVLVTLGLLGIVGVTLTNLNVMGMKANKSNKIRSDLADVKNTITSLLSCQETFSASSFASSARPITCPSGTIVILKGKSGLPLAPNNKIGEWTITAKCEEAGSPLSNGLSVYATKPRDGGGYMKDPLRNIDFDTNHPISTLFNPDVRPCKGYFSSSDSGSGITPGGLCQSFATEWYRGGTGTSKDGPWSAKTFTCPADFPVVMSVTSTPACSSQSWLSTMAKTGGSTFLNAAFCSNIFLWDSSHPDKAAAEAQCIASYGGDGRVNTASCSYACCNF